MGNVNEKKLWVAVESIRIDGGTQMRARIDEETVAEYAEHLTDLPPSITFFDGAVDWLADGFHRYAAHRLKKAKQIQVMRRVGTQREAWRFSLSANSRNGRRRSNDDKRKSVTSALDDEEIGAWRAAAIARECAVDESFVRKIRAEREKVVVTTKSDKPVSSLQRQSTDSKPADPADDMDFTKKDDKPAAKRQDKSEPVKDQEGHVITEKKVIDAFMLRGEVNHLLHRISQIKAEVPKHPLAKQLDMSQFIADCKNLYRDIASILPHAVCSYCNGRNPRCQPCKGTGWLNETAHKHFVPEDLKV